MAHIDIEYRSCIAPFYCNLRYVFFALPTAQVMYAYVMRPETLPTSYWNFIVRMGPISKPVLTAVRQSCRNLPIDVEKLAADLSPLGYDMAQDLAEGGVSLIGPPRVIPIISARVLRPGFQSNLMAVYDCCKNTFTRSFPLYLSLTLGPSLALRFTRFLRKPLQTVLRAFAGSARSALFIGALCSWYYAFCLGHRSLGFTRDSRFLYYWAGWVASLSIFIEKSSRRFELILYCAPRAFDSICQILVDRRVVPSIPGVEIGFFCASIATIVTCFEHYPSTVNPWVSAVAKRLLAGRIPVSSPSRRHALQNGNGNGNGIGSSDSDSDSGTDSAGSPSKLASGIPLTTIAEDAAAEAAEAAKEAPVKKPRPRRVPSDPHWLDAGISQMN